MKHHLIIAIKLTVLTILLFVVMFPITIWSVAKFAPNSGKGEIVEYNGQKFYTNIGQSFTQDQYFWSRPSAVNYNAAGSGASNKGASNEEYLKVVQARIDTFLIHHPNVHKSEIPVDLITASGSGLDPNISVQAAKVQIKRIAQLRNIDELKLNQLVQNQTEGPLWGIFGPEKINVLKLNIALDDMSKH